MSSTTKAADRKAATDVAAWMFNVVTSVGIIMVNKALMATYGFSFGISLMTYKDSALYYFLVLLFFFLSFCLNKSSHLTCVSSVHSLPSSQYLLMLSG